MLGENFPRHLTVMTTEEVLCVRLRRSLLLHRTPCCAQLAALTRAHVRCCSPAILRRDAAEVLLDLVTW